MTWDADRGNGILELCRAPDPAKVGERDPQTGLWPVRVSRTEPTSPKRVHPKRIKGSGFNRQAQFECQCVRCGKLFTSLNESKACCPDCAVEASKEKPKREVKPTGQFATSKNAISVTIGGREYPSIKQAALSLGASESSVRRAAKKGGKVRGLQVEAFDGKPIEPQPYMSRRRVKVDGVEFDSMHKAADAMGCKVESVKYALDQGRTSIKGFRIEEVRPSPSQVAAK